MTPARERRIVEVPVGRLRESPTNPRRTYGDLSELAESIKRQGILQASVARPVGERLEVVFGHRRLRAAKLAGLRTVPVDVVEMDDRQALEAQLELKPGLDTPELRLMVMALATVLTEAAISRVLQRRGCESVEQLLHAVSRRLSSAQLRGLLFELATSAWLSDAAQLRAARRTLGVDLARIERAVRHERAAEALFRKT